jgi:selenocysteine lyase/cysteine desulfurase
MVMWVSSNAHYYLSDVVEHEEGGTPDIVGNIHTGLVFSVKMTYGKEKLAIHEHELFDRIRISLKEMPNVVLLGPDADNYYVHHLPIISFLIKHGSKGKVLHHAFIFWD